MASQHDKGEIAMFANRMCIGTMVVTALFGATSALAEKNWAQPATKIYAQQLSDETMKAHPELLSVTFHGVPPGLTNIYTMFAGSYPERIGNPDDPDDIDVTKKGITIVDPRWHRTNDATPKFVVLEPLRDIKGENIGLIVYAFKVPMRANEISIPPRSICATLWRSVSQTTRRCFLRPSDDALMGPQGSGHRLRNYRVKVSDNENENGRRTRCYALNQRRFVRAQY
jgi:hypothetical protein